MHKLYVYLAVLINVLIVILKPDVYMCGILLEGIVFNKQIDKQTYGEMDEWKDGWAGGHLDEWTNRQIDERKRLMDIQAQDKHAELTGHTDKKGRQTDWQISFISYYLYFAR